MSEPEWVEIKPDITEKALRQIDLHTKNDVYDVSLNYEKVPTAFWHVEGHHLIIEPHPHLDLSKRLHVLCR